MSFIIEQNGNDNIIVFVTIVSDMTKTLEFNTSGQCLKSCYDDNANILATFEGEGLEWLQPISLPNL